MKKQKRGIALGLCLALLFSLGATAIYVVAASRTWLGAELGDLSQYYEIGDSADPGYISTVSGDSGGTSYGLYMFSSKAGTPYAFAKWCQSYTGENAPIINSFGSKLVYAYENPSPGYGSRFNEMWKECASEDASVFIFAQKKYWEENQYNSLLSNIKAKYPTFNVDNYSIALKNVLWSRSVQHGVDGATTVFINAMGRLSGGTFAYQSEADIICAIYAECSKLDTTPASNVMSSTLAEVYGINGQSLAYYSANSGGVQISVYRRLHVNEVNDALVMLTENTPASVTLHDGYHNFVDAENQGRILGNNGGTASVMDTASSTNISIKTTYYPYANGSYTLSNNGLLLTANSDGSVSFTAPSSSCENQMWHYESSKLLNVGTSKYLAITNGNFALVDTSESATSFTEKSTSGILSYGLIYPGYESYSCELPQGTGFPVRGTIMSSSPITKVTITVTGTSGFSASSSIANTSYSYDLWNLDKSCTFSKLSVGSYYVTITATDQNATYTLVDNAPFTVTEAPAVVETYTVTFNGGTTTTTKQYNLGDVYGELPVATKANANFVGWFDENGIQITSQSIVAAADHTLTARFDDLHTYKFLNADGSVFFSGQLSKGQNIPQPSTNPVKASDGSYTYTFSSWSGYTLDTAMGETDVSFSPIFTSTPISSGGGTSGSGGGSTSGGSSTGGGGSSSTTTTGSYLSGIVPNTSVSTLISGGYTVMNGTTTVTSGIVGTGMTATSNGTTVTIVVTGDVSGDGKLTITDVVKLQSNVTGKISLTGAYKAAADINKDGNVSITDVVQAAQVTVGTRTLSK